MLIKRKFFSILDEEGNLGYYLYDESTGEEKLFSSVDCDVLEQREFGGKSKALAILSPGAYQAKEAAKYAYDEDDYKKKRGGYALKGAFTPGTATIIKKKVEKMAREGASKSEIRDYLENKGYNKHLASGLGEYAAGVLTGGVTSPIAGLAATGVGLADKIGNRRANVKKSE